MKRFRRSYVVHSSLLVAAIAVAVAVAAGSGGSGAVGARAKLQRTLAPFAGAGGAPSATAAPGAGAPVAPVVVKPDVFSISPPLATVNVPVRPGPPKVRVRPELDRDGATTVREPARPDPVLQRDAPQAMPAATTYEGLNNSHNATLSGFILVPPDVNGDVGPSDYVEYINVVWSVYDKLTGAARPGFPKSNAAIWDGMGDPICEDWWEGDAVVMYDQAADRWFLSEFAFPIEDGEVVPPFKLFVAVSTTGNPAGSYARYSDTFQRPMTGGPGAVPIFPDYPKFGVWPDGYYVSINQFNAALDAYEGAGAGVFDRAKMIAGDPTASLVYFDTNDDTLGGMLPSDWEGDNAPPAGAPNIFLQADDSAVCCATQDRLQVWKLHADFATPSNSTFTHTSDITAAQGLAAIDMDICNEATYQFDCIHHPLATHRLDTLADRLMHRLQYRHQLGTQSLVVNQTVDANGQGQAGIRWYELRLDGGFNPSLHQHGTFAPGTVHRWMGSAAMDAQGNIAVGYSVADGPPHGTAVFPSINYAGRLRTDTLGQLAQGEATMYAGTGTQSIGIFGPSGATRWGDYTALQIDPVDECTFWYVNEYYPATHDWMWSTRFGKFAFPSCMQPTAVKVKAFSATRTRAGVRVDWRTAAAANTLGFHVWRSSGAKWQKLTRTLVRAKASDVAGASYRFVDRTARAGRFYTYRLQIVDRDGKRTWYGVGSAPLARVR